MSKYTAAFLVENRFCFAHGGKIIVANLATLEVLETIDCLATDEIAASPDGTKLAFFSRAASNANDVVMLDMRTGKEFWRQAAHGYVFGKPIVWSANGKNIATSHGSISETKIWNADNGTLRRVLALDKPSFSPTSRYVSGEVAPTSTTFYQFLGAGHGEVYEIVTGRLFMRLPHAGAFSPVSDSLLTYRGIWEPRGTMEEVAAAKTRLAGRTLTSEERAQFYLD